MTAGNERCGFVLNDSTIVEVDNVHPTPDTHFKISDDDEARYLPEALATWHTHPAGSSNLSVEDYHCFLRYDSLNHYIMGQNGSISRYYVSSGLLLRDDGEDTHTARLLGRINP